MDFIDAVKKEIVSIIFAFLFTLFCLFINDSVGVKSLSDVFLVLIFGISYQFCSNVISSWSRDG